MFDVITTQNIQNSKTMTPLSGVMPYGFESFNPEDPQTRFSRAWESRAYRPMDRDYDDFEKKSHLAAQATRTYLVESRSVRTPIEIYALWVELHVRQGGAVNKRTDSFAANGNAWMPTTATETRIPSGYGANALHLMLVPLAGFQNLEPSSGNTRSGWEYGHSRVYWFEATGRMIPKACTNTYRIDTHEDVEILRRSLSSTELAAKALDIMAQVRIPEFPKG